MIQGIRPKNESEVAEIMKSFKSPMVDYNQSMAEQSNKKLSEGQKRELIIRAAQYGDLVTLKKLVPMKNEELVNTLSNSQLCWAPIHYAAYQGHADIVETLLRQFFADVNIVNSDGQSALHLACVQGHK